MNFAEIFEDCKKRYRRFDKQITLERKPRSFEKAIAEKKNENLNPIIAEIKPASPGGKIRSVVDVEAIATQIVRGGACGISVLTEQKHFGGSLENLSRAAKASPLPVLRKDFIFDEAQIYEAYHYGADSLLLISSFLSQFELEKFLETSRTLGMEPLVEVHDVEDIKKARSAGARIYLINNRNKDTLEINLNRTKELSPHIEGIKISASGISSKADLGFVLKYCDAALIGSSIMKSENVEAKVREYVHARL